MGQKPFEVAAEVAMPGLPAGTDIERVSEQLEHARRRSREVVRTAVQTPAMFKDRSYVLETRFVVWAEDGEQAVEAVGVLLEGARIPHRSMHLSGRALGEADTPRPSAAPASARPQRPAPAKGKGQARVAKPARAARQRSGARAKAVSSRKPAGRSKKPAARSKKPAGGRRRR